jgi:hypothetical protein
MTKVLQRNVAAERDRSFAPAERKNLLSDAELDHVAGGASKPSRPTTTTGG